MRIQRIMMPLNSPSGREGYLSTPFLTQLCQLTPAQLSAVLVFLYEHLLQRGAFDE